jgi:hypothetical protein
LNEIILALMVWVQSNAVIYLEGRDTPIYLFSDVEIVESEIPKVVYMKEHEEFLKKCLSSTIDGEPIWTEEDLKREENLGILGCFNNHWNTIYIRGDLPEQSIYTIWGKALLVHELTHWFQHKQLSTPVASIYLRSDLEKLAYFMNDLYIRYRTEYAVDPLVINE